LPTKNNLIRRGVIADEFQLCVCGCGSHETSSHLFLHCNIFFVCLAFYLSLDGHFVGHFACCIRPF